MGKCPAFPDSLKIVKSMSVHSRRYIVSSDEAGTGNFGMNLSVREAGGLFSGESNVVSLKRKVLFLHRRRATRFYFLKEMNLYETKTFLDVFVLDVSGGAYVFGRRRGTKRDPGRANRRKY